MPNRTFIRNPSLQSDEEFDLCINDNVGESFRPHFHEFGHDFPMNHTELIELKDQIEKILEDTKNGR